MKVGDAVRCKEMDSYHTLVPGQLYFIDKIYGRSCDLIDPFGGVMICYLIKRFELDSNYQRRKKLQKLKNYEK